MVTIDQFLIPSHLTRSIFSRSQNATPGDNLPVIVFLVGGGYREGDNKKHVPCAMMNEDRRVIVVSPNFRMGALGFLSTGDSVLPGNMALKDQTMAFKWVQRNIRSFGGDPNRVTLHGFSSGAMNAHSHMFSPLSKGDHNNIVIVRPKEGRGGSPIESETRMKTSRDISLR